MYFVGFGLKDGFKYDLIYIFLLIKMIVKIIMNIFGQKILSILQVHYIINNTLAFDGNGKETIMVTFIENE